MKDLPSANRKELDIKASEIPKSIDLKDKVTTENQENNSTQSSSNNTLRNSVIAGVGLATLGGLLYHHSKVNESLKIIGNDIDDVIDRAKNHVPKNPTAAANYKKNLAVLLEHGRLSREKSGKMNTRMRDFRTKYTEQIKLSTSKMNSLGFKTPQDYFLYFQEQGVVIANGNTFRLKTTLTPQDKTDYLNFKCLLENEIYSNDLLISMQEVVLNTKEMSELFEKENYRLPESLKVDLSPQMIELRNIFESIKNIN